MRMKSDKPMVSVIVPIFNTEKFIQRCIDSICAQTYSNIELILVDDGSTDGSWDVIHRNVKLSENIVAIYQDNAGPSAARNNGIRHASGKYIMFCDSDDMVEPEWCEKMLLLAEKYPNTWIMCGIDFCDKEGAVIDTYCHGSGEVVLEKEDYWELFREGLTGGIWNKIYDYSLLKRHDLLFDENLKRGEDVIFNLHYLDVVEKCVTLSTPLYKYFHYDNVETLTNRYHSNDFDLYALLYRERKKYISPKDYLAFQRHYWGLFSNELENTLEFYNENGMLGKIRLNQKITKSEDFQTLLKVFGRQEMNGIAYWCLEKQFYFGYWLIQKLSKIKKLLKTGDIKITKDF